ncbi:MAG: cytochrome B6, partial [Anaerolineae bacterium]
MVKKWGVLLVFLIAVLLALPVINLLLGLPSHTPLTASVPADKEVARAFEVIEKNCGHCHIAGTPAPFYAEWPVARNPVRQDVEQALARVDFAQALVTAPGAAPSEPVLAKIEHQVQRGQMPPGRYVALHWNAALSDGEKAALNGWIRHMRLQHYARPEIPEKLRANNLRPIPASIKTDPSKVRLGEALYHDVRLSGDNTISCATCHDLTKGGTDQLPVSVGIRGQKGPINAPTVFNAAFQFAQFW